MDTAQPADIKTITVLRQKASRLRLISLISWTITFAGLILPIPFMLVHRGMDESLGAVLAILSMGSSFAGMAGVEITSRRLKRILNDLDGEQNALLRQMTIYRDEQTIGFVLERIGTTFEREPAEQFLTNLLPTLKASESHFLTVRHHSLLNRILRSGSSYTYGRTVSLCLAILKAYEQVGSIDDLPIVEQLAADEGSAASNDLIRQAARECLPYLQARSEQQASRQMLLRASDASAASGETLLRPAQATNPTAPHQLLRAASTETPE